MSTVTELQSKFDEISEIRQNAKGNFTISTDKKRWIAREYTAAREELRAASKKAMEEAAQPSLNADSASRPQSLPTPQQSSESQQGPELQK